MRPFRQVDVFTEVPLLGNPVAVVLDGEGLTTEHMQAFCDWTNLSEATFLLHPTDPLADYRLRIFCPGRELPFAGHPTLGSAHAWLEAGGNPKGDQIVQECGAGLVPIRRASNGSLSFRAPDLQRSGPLEPEELVRVCAFLGVQPEAVRGHRWCDNGPGWRGVLLDSAEEVLSLQPAAGLLGGMDVGVAGRHHGSGDLEVRAFFPGNGGALMEDPVTGSLNAALGQWLIAAGSMPARYVARQGTALGRRGRVAVEMVDQQIWVGGQSTIVLAGSAAI